MRVLVANITGHEVGAMMVMYPDSLGHCLSPGPGMAAIYPWQPFCYDNGCFILGEKWEPALWRDGMRRIALSGCAPLFVLVPDLPYSREGTLERWREFYPEVAAYGFKPGFAVQEGMTFDDVPTEAEVVFIGGGDDFKDAAIVPWCKAFPGRVHVGRVNGSERLLRCHHAGAVSVDGTGWFTKENNKQGGQWAVLMKYIRETGRRAA
jgi:hypothetical protein